MPNRQTIDLAKERLLIPTLWRLLELPGNPKASCRSPFRKDKKPSFSIYDRGRRPLLLAQNYPIAPPLTSGAKPSFVS
jgi:hypothetical protein